MPERFRVLCCLAGVVILCGCTAGSRESVRLSSRSERRVSRSSEVRVPPRHPNEFNPVRHNEDQFQDLGPGVPPEAGDVPVNAPAPKPVREPVKSVGFRKQKTRECGTAEDACGVDSCVTHNDLSMPGDSECLSDRCGADCQTPCGDGTHPAVSGWSFPRFRSTRRVGDLMRKKMKCLFRRDSCTQSDDEAACDECVEPLSETGEEGCLEFSGSDHACAESPGLICPDSCGDLSRVYSPAVRGRKPCLAESLRDPLLDQECQKTEGVHAPETAIEIPEAPANSEPSEDLSEVIEDFSEIKPVPIESGTETVIPPEPVATEIQPAETVVPVTPPSAGELVEPQVWRGPKSLQMVKPKVRTISSSGTASEYQHPDGSELRIIPSGTSLN